VSESGFQPLDPNFESRVRESFARQVVMATLGAQLRRVEPGVVEIVMPFRSDFTQQHGFLHAGIVAAIADSSCGYAAFSLMPADAAVLSAEFKINLLRPASGALFLARGRVLKPGRRVMACAADVFAVQDDNELLIASMLGTMMVVTDRPELSG
jgi:uncharacterized protein (TIGR00369 family)